MKIAFIGDSTTETYYLRAANNPALLGAPWNLSSGYDFSMGPAVQQYLNETHQVGNFARSGYTVAQALSQSVNYTAGVWGSPVTASGPMWTVTKAWAPDVVVINFGINDQSKSDFATFSSGIASIIADCQALGIRLIAWNGAYFYYGPTDTENGALRRTDIFPFFDELTRQTALAGYEVVDTRSRWQASVEDGTWDLLGHNDETYLGIWENGSTEPAIYQNVHQWIGGQELIASAIAEVIDYGVYDLDVTLTAPPATFRPRRQRMAALGGF